MIVNTNLDSVFKHPPAIPREWQERLDEWLRAIFGRYFEAVFKAQLEMLEAVIQVENEITALEARKKKLVFV